MSVSSPHPPEPSRAPHPTWNKIQACITRRPKMSRSYHASLVTVLLAHSVAMWPCCSFTIVELIFCRKSLYLLFSLSRRSVAQVSSGLLQNTLLPLCCSLSPYLAPFFLIAPEIATWKRTDLYTQSPQPSNGVKRLGLGVLVAVLSGPDLSGKSVMNVCGMNKCYPRIGEAPIKDVLEMSWRLVGFGSY